MTLIGQTRRTVDGVPVRRVGPLGAVAPDGRRFAIVEGVRQGTSDIVLADGALVHVEGSDGPSH